jgi:hypothetical protein
LENATPEFKCISLILQCGPKSFDLILLRRRTARG